MPFLSPRHHYLSFFPSVSLSFVFFLVLCVSADWHRRVCLRFQCGWPLSLLYGSRALASYELIFRFLLHLHLAQRQLADLWFHIHSTRVRTRDKQNEKKTHSLSELSSGVQTHKQVSRWISLSIISLVSSWAHFMFFPDLSGRHARTPVRLMEPPTQAQAEIDRLIDNAARWRDR